MNTFEKIALLWVALVTLLAYLRIFVLFWPSIEEYYEEIYQDHQASRGIKC